MLADINDIRIREILTLPGADESGWKSDLERLVEGDVSLTRKNAREVSVNAIQRLLIFLGYSTSSGGGFNIDGDYGLGTNRGIAQFRYDHNIDPLPAKTIAYSATWQTARSKIVNIPEVPLDISTLEKMIEAVKQSLINKKLINGDFAQAISNLNALHQRRFMNCKAVNDNYGDLVDQAIQTIADERNISVKAEWVLSIIKQETAGVVRPRFEQHYLSRLHAKNPHKSLEDLRYRSMSFGLGQIMGENYKRVGATSPKAMFFSTLDEQVLFVTRYLLGCKNAKSILIKDQPNEADFRSISRCYNGPAYAKHYYHNSIENWFREFREIRSSVR